MKTDIAVCLEDGDIAAPLSPSEIDSEVVLPVAQPSTHGSILLAGFWGRGNAGDEAMLQCIIETLGTEFDFAISVDELGAQQGFWNWYPYSGRQIVHQADADAFRRIERPLGILVGGGGLPIGFAGGQLVAARATGLTTAMAGVDLWPADGRPDSPMAVEMRRWLGSLDCCFTRTRSNQEEMKLTGCSDFTRLGADWALNLSADRSSDVMQQSARCMVILREDKVANLVPDYREQVCQLLRAISAAGYAPFFLPFSPEDVTFLDKMELRALAPVETCWWNARRLKQWIASSGLTVSVGRLHPLIFAAPTGCPIACIMTPRADHSRDAKLIYMCDDLGIEMHYTVQSFIDALPRGVRPAHAPSVAVARARLATQADHLRLLFSGRDLISTLAI